MGRHGAGFTPVYPGSQGLTLSPSYVPGTCVLCWYMTACICKVGVTISILKIRTLKIKEVGGFSKVTCLVSGNARTGGRSPNSLPTSFRVQGQSSHSPRLTLCDLRRLIPCPLSRISPISLNPGNSLAWGTAPPARPLLESWSPGDVQGCHLTCQHATVEMAGRRQNATAVTSMWL